VREEKCSLLASRGQGERTSFDGTSFAERTARGEGERTSFDGTSFAERTA
jgi:hypothetical protein